MTTASDLSVRWLPDEGPWRRFEFTSRGDRVEARLHAPAGGAPRPLAVVLAPEAAAIAPIEGVATLALDLPLLGRRASPKWTERLWRCLRDGPSGAADRALLEDVAGQAAHDVAAALDACAGLPGLAARTALLGIGPGAWVAPRLAEREPRIGAFVLAPDGLPPALDPGERLADGDRPWAAVAAAHGAARVREALADATERP